MGFLQEHCFFGPYTEDVVSSCDAFSCGDDDMDDFFRDNAFEYAQFKMGRSYCFRLKDHPGTLVCTFTLSNDSIRIYDLPRSRKDLMLKITRHQKLLKRYPGILLGRIAVSTSYARKGIGSEVLDFIKEWYADDNYPSGCRFMIVDALNDEKTLQFYRKNDFEFLFSSEEQENSYIDAPANRMSKSVVTRSTSGLRTRIMYYDLLNW